MILITGGAGYIGPHIVRLLAGREMVVLDDLSTGKKSSVLSGEFVQGDFGNEQLIDSLFTRYGFDSVIHLAGSILVPESVENPLKYYGNNSRKSLSFIKKCVEYGVKNFIFSSTSAVYGNAQNDLIGEDHPLAPLSPYAKSKLFVEWVLQDIGAVNSSFHYAILRYFNVAGASIDGKLGQYFPNATHLMKRCLQAALGIRDRLEIFGSDYPTIDGTCVRDYIHVEDLAQAHLRALDFLHEKKQSMIFNCGYGRGFSVKDVVRMIKKISQTDFNVKETGRRPGDPPRLVSNPQRIKSTLNWCPKHDDLEKIVNSAYKWEKQLLGQ